MSKSVKIPNYTKPKWECCINGIVYSYPAGSVQVVPKAVASFIERLENHSHKKEDIIPPFSCGCDDPAGSDDHIRDLIDEYIGSALEGDY